MAIPSRVGAVSVYVETRVSATPRGAQVSLDLEFTGVMVAPSTNAHRTTTTIVIDDFLLNLNVLGRIVFHLD